MNAEQRLRLREIIEADAIAFSVSKFSNVQIDNTIILRAPIKAMHKAIDGLSTRLEHILVDGNRFYPFGDLPFTCVIKGDAIYASIVAASVLAKTYRDECMQQLHQDFPMYNWTSKKGYPTKDHRKAIIEYCTCMYH